MPHVVCTAYAVLSEKIKNCRFFLFLFLIFFLLLASQPLFHVLSPHLLYSVPHNGIHPYTPMQKTCSPNHLCIARKGPLVSRSLARDASNSAVQAHLAIDYSTSRCARPSR
ncbi:hypothetical protein GGI43DRAFT_123116 [Trichoderma evansii]